LLPVLLDSKVGIRVVLFGMAYCASIVCDVVSV
jgi:hypothetical protein